LVVGLEGAAFDEGCEEDTGKFAGFGAGCEGLKKSRMDLFPGGMIHYGQELALYK
jgi:hypothetical protein